MVTGADEKHQSDVELRRRNDITLDLKETRYIQNLIHQRLNISK